MNFNVSKTFYLKYLELIQVIEKRFIAQDKAETMSKRHKIQFNK